MKSHTVYVLDVRLREISPPIWRTVELPGASTLEDVHFALQVAMGWTNSHLHQFEIGSARYGAVQYDEAPGLKDERRARLQDVVDAGDRFVYEYDFGDGWEHDVTVTKVSSSAKEVRPRCTAGARACPPEDCGGPGGYDRLLHVLGDPSDPEHVALVGWSQDYDPEAFEVPSIGIDLRREMSMLCALAEPGDVVGTPLGASPADVMRAALALHPPEKAALIMSLADSLGQDVAMLSDALIAMQQVAKSKAIQEKRKAAATPRPPTKKRTRMH